MFSNFENIQLYFILITLLLIWDFWGEQLVLFLMRMLKLSIILRTGLLFGVLHVLIIFRCKIG